MHNRRRAASGIPRLWLLISVCAPTMAATSALGADASPDAFANRFVAAINSKEPAKVAALIDSRSLACLSGEAADLLSFTIANWSQTPISAQYKAQIDDIGPDAVLLMDAFMPGRFEYPARPTRKVQINDVTATGSRMVIAEIGLAAGEWKIDLGCPKAGTVAWLKQARAERRAKDAEQGKIVDTLVASLSDDERGELIAMAKGGRWVDAAHKIEKDHSVELTIAVLAMKKLSPME